MGGYPQSGGHPFSPAEPAGNSVTGLLVVGANQAIFFFSNDVDSLSVVTGFRINGLSAVSIDAIADDYVQLTFPAPISDGQPWTFTPGDTDIAFVNGLPGLPASGVVG